MKKILNIFLRIILFLIVIVLFLLILCFIVHKIKLNKEYKYLNDNKYINLVDVGGYKLNIIRQGNKNSKYKIIGISGLGVNDYSVQMKYAIKNLGYDFIFIDRPGYGYSEDTKKEQNIEQIVNDYRAALKKLGIEGPYILMPHSLGGVYTTYWESMYPNEIKGIVMIDSTELSNEVDFGNEYEVSFKDYLELYLNKIGLGRLVLHKYYYKLPNIYSKKDNFIADSLNIKNLTSFAKLSEEKLMVKNTTKAYDNIKTNNIPKIYISANTGFKNKKELKEYLNWVINRQQELNLKKAPKIDDSKINLLLKQYEDWRNNRVIPYIEKLGNTELIYLPGDHYIFQQKPDELSKIINNFIEKL